MENESNDLVKEYQSKNDNKLKNFLSNIGPGHIFIFGICILVIIAITSNKTIDPRYNYVGYAILIGIILVLFFKPNKEKKILPRHVVINIAQEEMSKVIRNGKEFSYNSKITIGPACHLKYENDMMNGTSGPISWDIALTEHVHGTNYKKEGVISIHPYDGIITGIDWRPLGYTGRESRDRDLVPVGIVQGNIATTDFGKENRKTE